MYMLSQLIASNTHSSIYLDNDVYSSDEVCSSAHNYGCVVTGSVAWIANVLET